jgi:WD40 repeat protein
MVDVADTIIPNILWRLLRRVVALSSDLNYLASGHQDGGVRFWDVATAAKISLVPKAHTQHVHSLQWHPRSDRTLLVSSKEQPLKLIDTRTYEEVQVNRTSPCLSVH